MSLSALSNYSRRKTQMSRANYPRRIPLVKILSASLIICLLRHGPQPLLASTRSRTPERSRLTDSNDQEDSDNNDDDDDVNKVDMSTFKQIYKDVHQQTAR